MAAASKGDPAPSKRPSKFSKTLFTTICDRIANGESLHKICLTEGYPSKSTIVYWVMEDREGVAEQYARAREVQARLLADEILDISDDGVNDTYQKIIEGVVEGTVVNYDVIHRSKLRVDSRKWFLSKVLPKVYGDKLDLTHDGKVDVNHTFTGISGLLAAAKVKEQP